MENRLSYEARDASNRNARSESGYLPPRVQTFSPEEFMDLLGPAQGYGAGTDPPKTRTGGRTPRLFPGTR